MREISVKRGRLSRAVEFTALGRRWFVEGRGHSRFWGFGIDGSLPAKRGFGNTMYTLTVRVLFFELLLLTFKEGK